MSKEVICIMCPLGCRIQVHMKGKKVRGVEGERCKKGATYAPQEVTFPGRVLTTTVATDNPEMPLLPVRSDKALPKERLIECMKHISRHSVKGPVRLGQTVIENILGLGVDIIACRTIPLELPNINIGS
jgi:CxxC motif-containing protein